MLKCQNCNAPVVYTSQHLVGGRTPGWRCDDLATERHARLDSLGLVDADEPVAPAPGSILDIPHRRPVDAR